MEGEQAVRLARDSQQGPGLAGASSEVNGPREAFSLAKQAGDFTHDSTTAVKDSQGGTRLEGDNALLSPDNSNVQSPVSLSPIKDAVNGEVNGDVSAAKPKPQPSAKIDVDQTPSNSGHTNSATNGDSSLSADVDMADAPSQTVGNKPSSTSGNTRTAAGTASVAPPTERMTTRVASGALRQKSVSEILGEKSQIPLSQPPHLSKKSSTLDSNGQFNVRANVLVRDGDRKQRERLKASSMTLIKRDNTVNVSSMALMSEEYAALRGASLDPERHYLEPLFSYQAHRAQTPLQSLLNGANKTLTTANQYAALRESLDHHILKRIYQLQNANRWPLRQMEKCPEPPRPTTFIDHLLAQMKSMRTDFRQERRWRAAVARSMAGWCAEWVASSPEQRASLQVKVKPRPTTWAPRNEDGSMMTTGETMDDLSNVADAVLSTVDTDMTALPEHDKLHPDGHIGRAPVALFSLGYGDVVLEIDNTPSSDGLLLGLPLYEPSVAVETPSRAPEHQILPVSKFVTGKLISTATGPSRKRSRYEYDDEEEPDYSNRMRPSDEAVSSPSRRSLRIELPPEQSDVALFNPENKHVRDRLHASHAFRPPSEFSMPSTAFFESRMSSQWLWEEDQKLRTLVKEFSYNWSLISDFLKIPSLFTSGAERRTPWECFERWVLLEGLPADMSKTQYFRTYQARLEAAQRTVAAQHQAAQQQLQQQAQTPNQALNTPLRRRTSQPIRVERRRNNRYLVLIDCMRKLARQRETKAHKQQEGMYHKIVQLW